MIFWRLQTPWSFIDLLQSRKPILSISLRPSSRAERLLWEPLHPKSQRPPGSRYFSEGMEQPLPFCCLMFCPSFSGIGLEDLFSLSFTLLSWRLSSICLYHSVVMAPPACSTSIAVAIFFHGHHFFRHDLFMDPALLQNGCRNLPLWNGTEAKHRSGKTRGGVSAGTLIERGRMRNFHLWHLWAGV